jgi:hypothetical protein
LLGLWSPVKYHMKRIENKRHKEEGLELRRKKADYYHKTVEGELKRFEHFVPLSNNIGQNVDQKMPNEIKHVNQINSLAIHIDIISKMKQEQIFQEFCEQVLSFDADEHGSLLAVSEHKGLKPLLNPEERSQYAITSATRHYTRLRWQNLLGSIEYATSVYEKLIRATVPIIDNDNHLAFIVLMSFDTGTENFYGIIKNNILPLVTARKRQFLQEKKQMGRGIS